MPADRCAPDVAATLMQIGERLGARPGHMFGHPALYAGRRLAVCAYGAGLGLKLSAERVSELIGTGHAVHFQPYDKPPMREWAYQPVTSSDDVVELAGLIEESITFAGSGRRP